MKPLQQLLLAIAERVKPHRHRWSSKSIKNGLDQDRFIDTCKVCGKETLTKND